MQSGYKILWSDRAISDLKNILDYLEYEWTDKEIKNFLTRLDKRLGLIIINPKLFSKTSKRKNVRRSVLTKHTVIYYTASNDLIKILTLFDPRKNPKKLKL
jgi:plasmid stabilization system protein ParE